MRHDVSCHKMNGFTLVELAIVLMIIGLLVGGVLRGQELIRNAENTEMIQQVKSYQGAITTFRDVYNNMPGDMVNATTKLPGCTTQNKCENGDGNGIVGTVYNGDPWMNIDPSITSENTQFWKHLALAHLISGIDPSANDVEWGRSHPMSKIAGGFFIRYATFSGNDGGGQVGSPQSTHLLVTRRTLSGAWDCGSVGAKPVTGACTTSPQRASQIDQKMDDGIAMAGDVTAISAHWNTGCGTNNLGINGPNGYADNIANASACDMMFQIK